MSPLTRRVRRASLEARDEGMVRRGAVLLEDALRTASLGDGGGRLVLVRRLDAGVIRPGGGPSSVALQLERSYRRAEATAVHASDASSPSAPAVWFRDAVEAHALLAARLSLGAEPSAWFWRLAVPAWQGWMPRDEALRAILASAADTEAGAGALVSLAVELHALGALGGLLDALRPADGGALVAACGWRVPSSSDAARPASALAAASGASPPPSPGTAVIGVDVGWRAVVAERAARWGMGDARTLWLAAVALVADAPARMLDPALPARARALVEAVARPASSPSGPDGESGRRASPESVSSEAGDGRRAGDSIPPKVVKSVEAESNGAGGELRPSSAESTAAADRRTESVEERASAGIAPSAESRGEGRGGHPPDRESQVESAQASADARRGDGATEERWDASRSAEQRARDAERRAESRTDAEAQREGATGEERDAVRAEGEADAEPRRRALTDGVPRETAGAGLLFLIPVLERLGMAALLRDQPHLVVADLPARVLARVARRVGIPSGDPVLDLFPPSPRDPGPLPFAWPPVWERGITREGPWPVRPATRGRRVLFDASGRLPLAAWWGETPERVASAETAETVRSGAEETRSDVELLAEAWAMAARRWCRRYARMGLRAVVLRPGGVAATRTHVDVLLDHRRADVRARRAGMDIDPGWVPWLGRVVGFHYVHGGERG